MAKRSPAPETVLAFSALRHRDYRKYFLAGVLAMLGDNIEHVISYWVIFHEFHSPSLGGFAVISHWVPFLFFSVYAGALADRFDCRRLIQTAQGLLMLVSLAWGVLFLTGTLKVWHSVVLLLLHGGAGVIFDTSAQLIVHDIVGPEHLQSAIRLNATSRQLAILFGPAVGGGLMLLVGPAWGLVSNVLVYSPLILILAFLPYTGHTRERAGRRAVAGIGFKEAGRVFRQVRSDSRIVSMILLAGATSLLVGNAFVPQMPEYARNLGADDSGFQYSALLAANAAGAVIGALLLESTGALRPKARTAIICGALWSLTMVLFPAAPSYGTALVLLLFAGAFNIAFAAMAQTLVQLLAPVELRGRVVGLFNMANLGLRVGSGLTVGVLGGFIGIYWSLGLSAAMLLLVVLGLLVFDAVAARR